MGILDKKILELPEATTPLSGAEYGEIVQGGVNKKVRVLNFTGSNDLLIDLVAVSVSGGTMTLNLNNQKQRRFYDSATQTGNFTIAFSNDSSGLIQTLDIQVTGTISITMPSTVVMQEDDNRFNNTTKVFTAAGGTASPFEFSWTKSGSVWKLKASRKYYPA